VPDQFRFEQRDADTGAGERRRHRGARDAATDDVDLDAPAQRRIALPIAR
jgi:hypothetical protein